MAAILEEGKGEREREKSLGRDPVLRCARLKWEGCGVNAACLCSAELWISELEA